MVNKDARTRKTGLCKALFVLSRHRSYW